MSLEETLACSRRLIRDSVCVLFPERSRPSITMNAPRLGIVVGKEEVEREQGWKVHGRNDSKGGYMGYYIGKCEFDEFDLHFKRCPCTY